MSHRLPYGEREFTVSDDGSTTDTVNDAERAYLAAHGVTVAGAAAPDKGDKPKS